MGFRGASLLQGRIRATARQTQGHAATLAAERAPGEQASDNFTSEDLAVGLISGRRTYWHSVQRSMLQFTNGVIIDVPGECPCGFRASMVTLREAFPDAKWYYIGDEDIFLNVRNLKKLVRDMDWTVPTIIGRPGFETIENVCGIKQPAGFSSTATLFGGTGHIVSAAMFEALDYKMPCSGNHSFADRDHTCFLLEHWQPNFRYVPLVETQLVQAPSSDWSPAVPVHSDWILEQPTAFQAPIVTHKLLPEEQDNLATVNVDSTAPEVSVSDLQGRDTLRPRVLRSFSNVECDDSDTSITCLNTCQRDVSGDGHLQASFFLDLGNAVGPVARQDVLEHSQSPMKIFLSDEVCFDAVPEGAEIITFLTEPRSHVYSQYKACSSKYSSEAGSNRSGEVSSLLRWLEHTDSLDCNWPVNLQTRLLSCSSRHFFPGRDRYVMRSTEVGVDHGVDVDLAAKRVTETSEIKFVGITELYQESMCLIHIQSMNQFPSYCNCEEQSWNDFPMKTETRELLNLNTNALDADALPLVDNVTAFDRQIYDLAKQRLLQEIRAVERLYGRNILCGAANTTA